MSAKELSYVLDIKSQCGLSSFCIPMLSRNYSLRESTVNTIKYLSPYCYSITAKAQKPEQDKNSLKKVSLSGRKAAEDTDKRKNSKFVFTLSHLLIYMYRNLNIYR